MKAGSGRDAAPVRRSLPRLPIESPKGKSFWLETGMAEPSSGSPRLDPATVGARNGVFLLLSLDCCLDGGFRVHQLFEQRFERAEIEVTDHRSAWAGHFYGNFRIFTCPVAEPSAADKCPGVLADRKKQEREGRGGGKQPEDLLEESGYADPKQVGRCTATRLLQNFGRTVFPQLGSKCPDKVVKLRFIGHPVRQVADPDRLVRALEDRFRFRFAEVRFKSRYGLDDRIRSYFRGIVHCLRWLLALRRGVCGALGHGPTAKSTASVTQPGLILTVSGYTPNGSDGLKGSSFPGFHGFGGLLFPGVEGIDALMLYVPGGSEGKLY